MRCQWLNSKRENWVRVAAALSLLALSTACDGGGDGGVAERGGAAQEGVGESSPPSEPENSLPDAGSLLAESVEALGGADKFAAMKSYYSEAEVDMGALGVKGTAKMWWKGGDFYGETLLPGFGNTRMGGHGGEIWSEDPINGMRVVTGKEADQTAWSTSVCLPCEWERFFKTAKTIAVKQADGRELAEVELRTQGDHAVVFEIDLKTKLPHAQRFDQVSPLGKMPVRITFEDYRAEGGLTLSYKQTVNAKLTKFSSTITRFDMNVPIDDQRFAKPGAANTVDMARPDSIATPVEKTAPASTEGDASAGNKKQKH